MSVVGENARRQKVFPTTSKCSQLQQCHSVGLLETRLMLKCQFFQVCSCKCVVVVDTYPANPHFCACVKIPRK